MMADMCGDNRFEIIEKAKEELLGRTNIHTSKDEMKVIDDFLFRCWQMGWLERYDKPKERLDIPTMTTEFIKEHGLPCPSGYEFKDEQGNVIEAKKIVLEKKSPKTVNIIKWLREHDMTKYIGVIYSGMCSITFDTEKLIKDITEMIGDE